MAREDGFTYKDYYALAVELCTANSPWDYSHINITKLELSRALYLDDIRLAILNLKIIQAKQR